MEKIKYRLVYNRQNKLNRQGTALVQAEAYLNERKVYIRTNVYLRAHEWDKRTGQVVNHPQEHALNAYLYDFIIHLQTIELGFWKRGRQCTLAMLKAEHFKGHETTDVGFIKFAERAISESDRRQSTKENMRTTLKVLCEFRRGLDFKDLTCAFVKEFENFLKQKGKAVNTIAKHLRQLRTLVNEAINEGYMAQEDYPFRKIKIHKEQGRHTTLLPHELRRLERLELDNQTQQRTLDGFLFCVYSGLRFSDFKALKSGNIITIRGQRWLSLVMQKTDIEIRSPLHLMFEGKGLDLIDKYGTVEQLAKITCNSDANRTLQAIAEKAKIKKHVTWHSARHTCATILIHDGVPITTVQKLLGHTSLRTTQIYTKVFSDTIIKDLKTAAKKRKSG